MLVSMRKKVFNLHNRYIPALTLIAVFSTLAFINVQDIMHSITNDGKLINISGRQRMLSQKIILTANEYIIDKNINIKNSLIDTLTLMEKEHKYLMNQSLSSDLQNIYYKQKLDNEIIIFIQNIYLLIEKQQLSLLYQLREDSKNILLKLDQAVEVYEYENKIKLQILKNREQYLYFLTLLTLLIEAIFIFYPASKKILLNEKELQAQVNEKTKELQDSFDLISQHIIYSQTDLAGNITYASRAFCEISGYSKEELIGKSHNIIRHPDMPKNAFKEMWDTIKNGKEWTGEVKNLKKDGGYYWVIAHISPKYDKNNILVGYSGVRENISDKKALDQLNKNLTIKIQEEIEKNRENELQLYEQEKMIQMTEMIGNIAHHWRQPLSVISTATSGMQLQKEYQILSDEFFNEATENILKQTENLSKTIEQFTDYINLEDIKTSFSLEKHLEETLDIVNFTFKNFDIEMIIDIKKSNMEIYSNKTLISQVLLNILYNSRDILSTRKIKKPKVYIGLEKVDNNFIITIEDNGGGVKEEDLKKVFEPYFTTKHKSVGTGLGLNICYSIVTLKLKGKIFVKNSSKGALFTVILPI